MGEPAVTGCHPGNCNLTSANGDTLVVAAPSLGVRESPTELVSDRVVLDRLERGARPDDAETHTRVAVPMSVSSRICTPPTARQTTPTASRPHWTPTVHSLLSLHHTSSTGYWRGPRVASPSRISRASTGSSSSGTTPMDKSRGRRLVPPSTPRSQHSTSTTPERPGVGRSGTHWRRSRTNTSTPPTDSQPSPGRRTDRH